MIDVHISEKHKAADGEAEPPSVSQVNSLANSLNFFSMYLCGLSLISLFLVVHLKH